MISMKETPPPFHSRTRSRTRPARRRPEPDRSPDLKRIQRRLSRSSIGIAALIAVLSLTSAGLFRARQSGDTVPPVALTDTASVDVTRVIDGDTLDVRAAETTLRVRLYGVDTAERGEACYREATERLTALAGNRVLLLPDARLTDQNGRELRYVFTADGQSIDAALIREGLAKAWREDGSRKAELIALEEAARISRTGCLWSASPGAR